MIASKWPPGGAREEGHNSFLCFDWMTQ